MGSATGGACYSDAAAAAAAACSAGYPQAFTDGTTTYTNSCTGVSGAGTALDIVRSQAGSASSVSSSLGVSFPACDPLERYADLSALWLLLVGAAAIVWLTKQFFWRLVANH